MGIGLGLQLCILCFTPFSRASIAASRCDDLAVACARAISVECIARAAARVLTAAARASDAARAWRCNLSRSARNLSRFDGVSSRPALKSRGARGRCQAAPCC